MVAWSADRFTYKSERIGTRRAQATVVPAAISGRIVRHRVTTGSLVGVTEWHPSRGTSESVGCGVKITSDVVTSDLYSTAF
jgi:hypothetical protein